MKTILSAALLLFIVNTSFAQDKVNLVKEGDVTKATYFHENGSIEQEGYFNKEGKVHGTWTSYDSNGKKLAVGKYSNGKKQGKWFFWNEDTLKEVDFIDSRIVNVSEWKNSSPVVIRD